MISTNKFPYTVLSILSQYTNKVWTTTVVGHENQRVTYTNCLIKIMQFGRKKKTSLLV